MAAQSFLSVAAAAFAASAAGDIAFVADRPYPQEVARTYRAAHGLASDDVQLLDLAPDGRVLALAGGQWRVLRDGRAEAVANLPALDAAGFLFLDAQGRAVSAPLPAAEVRQLARATNGVWLATANDAFRWADGRLDSLGWVSRMRVNQIAVAPDGTAYVASDRGLFVRRTEGWQPLGVVDEGGRAWAVRDVLGTTVDAGGRLWFSTRAGAGVRAGEAWSFFTGREGLPWSDFTGIAAGPDGAVWFGTRLGAVRFDGTDFAYRQGPRWLPADEVRQVLVDREGGAWFATTNGVGWLGRRRMTLADKAAFYEGEVERYIKRTGFGFTSEVNFAVPGDRASALTRPDSDNDGLWTAMYGAGQCFAYAATRGPEFKRRATQAFEAVRFLQTVTQGGPHSPPPGFVARTILPGDGPDPNAGRLEADRRTQAEDDKLWKVYEPRWPRSADGKWFWKSDTSSDELDGHYFLYAAYFDHVAETEAERARVREVVRGLTDHLVAHRFCLMDHDGTPTRWGRFGPQHLNDDPWWWAERGLNSLSMLSYLFTAGHITGDAKYAAAARELMDRHGYAANVMNPKAQTGPGSGNQSDDEMAFMCFHNLLKYAPESPWKERWRYAFHAYAMLELPERNPLFNFLAAAHGLGRIWTHPWGTASLDPWDGWLEDGVATLRGFPLDRFNWPQRNSHRLDLVLLPPQQSPDLYGPVRAGRGHRVDGRVLPVAERHFGHWNTDPWRLDYGGDGRELASGTVFLLPYYLGLKEGFIRPAGAPTANAGQIR
ncbi:MAG: hypothetical protein ACKVYV_06615 [Limisphaerales bacterium]